MDADRGMFFELSSKPEGHEDKSVEVSSEDELGKKKPIFFSKGRKRSGNWSKFLGQSGFILTKDCGSASPQNRTCDGSNSCPLSELSLLSFG